MIEALGTSNPEGSAATFSELLDRFLEEGDRLDLSPTTLRTYRSQIDRTIRPVLGKVQLARLTAKDLDRLYGAMKADGRSAKTIRNHHAIISAALNQGVRWGWIRDNVAENARPPRVATRRVRPPSLEDVQRLIEAAGQRDPRLAPLVVLAALTGMRRAELCALRWTDVHLDQGILDVSRSLIVVPGGVREKTTKTDRERVVAIDSVAVDLLRGHRANVETWIAEAEGTLAPDAFVFSPFVEGTTPFRPDNVTGFFTRVRDSLDLKSVRLHDLRHFTATQLIGAGVDLRTVAGRLGHTDPSMTMRTYAHVIQDRDRAAAEVMGQILGGKPPQPVGDGAATQ
jgi:integrase